MNAAAQPRDRGRFGGHPRINTETTPCLPASCGRMVLADPKRGPLLAVWLDPADRRAIGYLVVVEAVPDLPDAVKVFPLGQSASVVRLITHQRPQGPWTLWLCPGCSRPSTGLYLLARGADDAPRLGLACRECSGLHYASRSAPAVRSRVLRALLGVQPGERIPTRLPLVPDRLVRGARAIKALRLKNLQVQAVEAGTELALVTTP